MIGKIGEVTIDKKRESKGYDDNDGDGDGNGNGNTYTHILLKVLARLV